MDTVVGDLLNCQATIIAHQCNSVTSRGKGLSGALFSKFSYADIYSCRSQDGHRDTLGKVIVRTPHNQTTLSSDTKEPVVFNMVAQRYPGPSKYDNDSIEKREQWFASCLQEMASMPACHTSGQIIAFPENIGCGLAGGTWLRYRSMIEKFSEACPEIKVIIVRWSHNPQKSKPAFYVA